MVVDLRSDTVTKPTKEMMEVMFSAEVGDDVLGDDPTVIALEEKSARLFGKEAALFCPSGTMTNQIAIKVHTNAPGEVICDDLAHIYRYEGGGIGFNSGLATKLLKGDRGRFTLEQLQAAISPEDIHFPPSQLVSIENTCNKGGGSLWDIKEIERIATFCKKENLPLHLDGARIFNALVAQNIEAKEMGIHFDSISICLSKGLGCPIGSVLIGSKKFIHQAKRIRKIFGGGMRQAGLIAAAGIYALDNHVERLKIDHNHALLVSEALKDKEWVKSIQKVESNIVIFELKESINQEEFITKMKDVGILLVGMGPQLIRIVTHLDIHEKQVDYLIEKLNKLYLHF